MKRILLALLIGSATLTSFSSCTKEYVTPISKTIIYERTANQWVANGNFKNTKYVDLDVPELNNYYVNQGVINLSISFDKGKTYSPIAATIDGISYNYDYTPGSIRIYAQDPIFQPNSNVGVPDHLFIKVTLSEADLID